MKTLLLIGCLALGSAQSRRPLIAPPVPAAAGGTITFVAAGLQGVAGTGNASPGWPAGMVANDIAICICHVGSQESLSMDPAWTIIDQGNGGGTSSHLAIWWIRYDGGATPTLTVTPSVGGNTITAGIAGFRGCKTTGSPIDTFGAFTGGTDGSIEHAAITVAAGTMLLVGNGAGDDNARTILSPYAAAFAPGGNNDYLSSLGSPDSSVALFYGNQAAGSTGILTVTQAASDPWTSILVSLLPP